MMKKHALKAIILSFGLICLSACTTVQDLIKGNEDAVKTERPEQIVEKGTPEDATGASLSSKYTVQIEQAERRGAQLYTAMTQESAIPPDAEALRTSQIAAEANYKRCAHPYKSVPITLENSTAPGEAIPQRETYVYQISSPKNEAVLSLGVHHRLKIAKDEWVPNELISYTTNCLEVVTEPNSYAVSMTHSRTPYPEDIHVWLSLMNKIEVYVRTRENDQNWVVRQGKISKLDTPSREQKALLEIENNPDADVDELKLLRLPERTAEPTQEVIQEPTQELTP